MSNYYVPLRVISGFSFLQSGLTIPKIIDSVKKRDFYGAAINDYDYLYGVPSFIEACEKNNIKYIFGSTFVLEDAFSLYVLNEEGYRNLIYLSNLRSDNKLNLEELKNHLSGICLIINTKNGVFASQINEGFSSKYLHLLADISSKSDSFYLGIEIICKEDLEYAKKVREFAESHAYETIAFPKVQYQNKEDDIILKIVEAIGNDERLEIKASEGQYFFYEYPVLSKLYTKKELDNTVKVLDSFTFKYHQKRGEMYHFPIEDKKAKLKEIASKALVDKNINDKKHNQRLDYELDVISKMGYEDYFLIVSDYVNYAKNNGILVGPGRGSAAGSLLSYLLNITEVDPLDYGLLFERFLNEARKSMPDIDVDFMDTRKDEVVQYIRHKYGENKVAEITTFQTILAKQALRDIARIYDYPSRHIDMLSKNIPDDHSLREAYKKSPAFKAIVDSDKYFLEIVSLASKIENLPRQPGRHAAGIILNNVDLTTVTPTAFDIDSSLAVQYEKDYIEEQGFLKMDILSLSNLTTIHKCLELIKKNKGVEISPYKIPYDNSNIYKLISSLMVAGIFQIESGGMRNAIKILKPKNINDLAVLLALFRPGPMDNIKEYKAREEGKKKYTFSNNAIKEVLEETYGIIIYQEQISKIAITMAGYTPNDADLFRRAVSHKEKEVLLKAKTNFINGSINNGYSKVEAEKVFNDIVKFADYGFNKSHAVVYAIIAARMAYLKYYYPQEFYSALLSGGVANEKFSEYVAELKKRNLNVYIPDINKSTNEFIVMDKGILYPLNAIKGVSNQLAGQIIDERMLNGEYKDFFDFVLRTYKYKISESNILKLVDAGAFDALYPSRAALRKTISYAQQLAALSSNNEGEIILEDMFDSQKQYFEEKDDPLENLNKEYEVLGLMLSDNPLRYKKDLLEARKVVSLADIKDSTGYINIAGIVSNIKTIKIRKSGENMAFIKIFDETGEIEVTVFARIYANVLPILKKNNTLLIRGRYENRDERSSFIAEEISLLEEEK